MFITAFYGGLMIYIIIILIALISAAIVFKPGSTPKIKNGVSGKSLAELKNVNIGNTKQWILIRSENIDNPALLYLHGGPGTSMMALARKNTRELEKYFTIVNWDQRGAAKSFNAGKDESSMNIERFVDDIIELTEYLIKRFNKSKIVLAGHSWGTSIGMLAVSKRPDLYCAYIGIGQVSDTSAGEVVSYDWTLEQAKLSDDKKAVENLIKIGRPPYTGNWKAKFLAERKLLAKFGGEYYGSKAGAFPAVFGSLIFSTEYTFSDRINFLRGVMRSLDLLFPEFLRVNLFQRVPEVKIPIWFMLGRYDYEVPSTLAEKYFNELRAPSKNIFWFEKSAHLPNVEEREIFNRILIEKVVPAVLRQVN